MTGQSRTLAKDFHRMMKRIGRLTDGQASIDNVDWDSGSLTSFTVTIRPNAGHYQNGRFKFTVDVPEDFTTGEPPSVWCDTDVYHPNIDRTETRTGRFTTNVCLNILEHGSWSASYGLEGVVLGILFLMHNPNWEDPLSPEFDSGSLTAEDFADNVRDYMAGNTVDGAYYSMDFRVINGEFEEIQQAESETEASGEEECIIDDSVYGESDTETTDTTPKQEINTREIVKDTQNENQGETNTVTENTEQTEKNLSIQNAESNGAQGDTATLTTNCVNTTNQVPDIMDEFDESDDEEEIMPIKFVVDDQYDDYFVLNFVGHTENTPSCDNTIDNTNANPSAVIDATVCDELADTFIANLNVGRERSKSISNLNEVQGKPVLSRSISVPSDFEMKVASKHKPAKSVSDMCLRTLACVALDCILTVYKNLL